jgi:excisionase family DNA binding protein
MASGMGGPLPRKPTPRHVPDTPKQPAPDALALSPQEAAWLLGVRPVAVRQWVASGKLPAVRLGRRTIRIRRSDVERFLTDQAATG